MNLTVREFLNENVIENDVFEDIVNNTSHYETIDMLEKYFIISEFIELVSNIVNISAYMFLAITICRFKKLKSRTNTYILHLTILNIIFTIQRVILNTSPIPEQDKLVLEQASTSVLILYLAIAFILGLDWFISGFRPYWLDKYSPYYKYLLAVMYGITLTEYLLTFVYTHMHHMIRMGIYKSFYFLLVICLVVLNIMKRSVTLKSNSARTSYAFTVSNVIVLPLLPVFIWHTILSASLNDNYIFVCISIIVEILWYNHPIIVVYLLGSQNKYFKMAYQKSFKRSVQAYDDEDFLGDSQDGNDDERNHTGGTINHSQDNGFRQTSFV